jgi:hypothetical protein
MASVTNDYLIALKEKFFNNLFEAVLDSYERDKENGETDYADKMEIVLTMTFEEGKRLNNEQLLKVICETLSAKVDTVLC